MEQEKKLNRLEGELWTNFITRKLKLEGFNVEDFYPMNGIDYSTNIMSRFYLDNSKELQGRDISSRLDSDYLPKVLLTVNNESEIENKKKFEGREFNFYEPTITGENIFIRGLPSLINCDDLVGDIEFSIKAEEKRFKLRLSESFGYLYNPNGEKFVNQGLYCPYDVANFVLEYLKDPISILGESTINMGKKNLNVYIKNNLDKLISPY